ncbi:MAG: fumarylacetoacetate hydrolase family protein [Pseudomonadota bacterium]
MLDEAKAREAARLIAAHWQSGRQMEALPTDLRPQSREEGYAIQAHLEQASERPLFGWKIAATSVGGQQHIGADGPLAGRLFSERVLTDGEATSLEGNHMAVAEPEFAFRMARPLHPRPRSYDVDEVLAAVGALHLAIELPGSRFVDFASVGAPQLIADNACTHEFLPGPAADESWRGLDLSRQEVTAIVPGKAEQRGSGGAVLGDPRVALTWLANELSSLGLALEEGQVVTTGTTTVPLPIQPGDQVRADFGQLGAVTLQIGR